MADVRDLHDAFAHLAELVPDEHEWPDRLDLSAYRRPARHRSLLTPLLAVAAVAVVALTLAYFGTRTSSPPADHTTSTHQGVHPRPTPTKPTGFGPGLRGPSRGRPTTLALSFSVAPVAGFSFQPLEANRLYQSYEVGIDALANNESQDVARGGEIYLFYRGVYDPTKLPHLATVDVNGHRGFVTRVGTPSEIATTTPNPEDAVVWEYAPDAWGLVSVDGSGYRALGKSPRVENLALARAVRPDSVALRLPIRLGYLPAGLSVEGAQSSTERVRTEVRSVAALGLADGRPRASGPVDDLTVGSALTINVSTGFGRLVCSSGCSPIRAGGYHAYLYRQAGRPAEIGTMVGRTEITISVDPAHLGRFTSGRLTRILAELVVASDPTDPTTWFDATTAVP